jgi:hypothetical protein
MEKEKQLLETKKNLKVSEYEKELELLEIRKEFKDLKSDENNQKK